MVETPVNACAPANIHEDHMAHAAAANGGSSSVCREFDEDPEQSRAQPLQQDLSHQVNQRRGSVLIVPLQR